MAPLVRGCFVFGHCFVMQYLVSFFSFATISLGKRELGLYFDCILVVMWLFVFCAPSSPCPGLVCDCGITWPYSLVVLQVCEVEKVKQVQ